MVKTYTHALGEEIHSISGWYELEREVRIEHSGREILYVVGQGVVDSSCCGMGGCRYAIVPGFIVRWKTGTDEDGSTTSTVEPITDQSLRDKIKRLVEQREGVSQVQFW